MKITFILMLYSILIYGIHGDDCEENTVETDCTSTDYRTYLDCLSNKKHRRKRSLGCQSSCENTNSCATSCDECDCGSCYGCSYLNTCSNCCSSCCQTTTCKTNHCCHKFCHANCRTSTCRSSCRQSCTDQVKTVYVVGNSTAGSGSFSGNSSITNTNRNTHNITTIIHLRNVINNTNVIDAPIRINTTNYNNISIPNVWSYRSNLNGSTSSATYKQNCCTVLSPRQCVRKETFPFVRCFHYRYKMCGDICYSKMIHGYQQQVCNDNSCKQQVAYIPQPRPSCAYTNNWPYVSCGAPQQPNCEGCYGHHFGQEKRQCNPFCFDDGFGMGQYYRQGPFFQPGYSFVPPCYQMGGCGGFGGYPGYGTPPLGYNMNPYFAGYNPGFIPPMPAYPGPIGVPPFSGFGGYQPPMFPTNDQNDQTIDDSVFFNRLHNVSMAGPIQEDEPFLYNPLAFQLGGNYPSFKMYNITHDPRIEARVSPYVNKTYAEIKIAVPNDKETEDNVI